MVPTHVVPFNCTDETGSPLSRKQPCVGATSYNQYCNAYNFIKAENENLYYVYFRESYNSPKHLQKYNY